MSSKIVVLGELRDEFPKLEGNVRCEFLEITQVEEVRVQECEANHGHNLSDECMGVSMKIRNKYGEGSKPVEEHGVLQRVNVCSKS